MGAILSDWIDATPWMPRLHTRAEDAAFIALLDADHRARLGWISASVSTLATTDFAGVQSRKRPLATLKGDSVERPERR